MSYNCTNVDWSPDGTKLVTGGSYLTSVVVYNSSNDNLSLTSQFSLISYLNYDI
jgi:WD40 repeat protein